LINPIGCFIPPERRTCEHFDPFPADIWATGITFYVVAARALPPEPIGRIPPAVPASLANVIRQMVAFDPEKRPTLEILLSNPIFHRPPSHRGCDGAHISKCLSVPGLRLRKAITDSKWVGSSAIYAAVRQVESTGSICPSCSKVRKETFLLLRHGTLPDGAESHSEFETV
jgi:serine/threonine protein kinase